MLLRRAHALPVAAVAALLVLTGCTSTVDGTAVYYPPKLKRAAQELGYDLGIKKLKPAQEPMQFDRLTVILTDDYS